MTHKAMSPFSSRAIILLLVMLLQLHTITMLTIVKSSSSSLSSFISSEFEDAKSESLSISSGRRSSVLLDQQPKRKEDSSLALSKETAAPLLTFSLFRSNGGDGDGDGGGIGGSVSSNGSLEQSNPVDNNAGIHKTPMDSDTEEEEEVEKEDNEGGSSDNNDSNVSSEFDTDGGGGRFRRADVVPSTTTTSSSSPSFQGVIGTNWGTYEEQAPVVVHSGSHSAVESDAGRMATDDFVPQAINEDNDDDSYGYGDEYQSDEKYDDEDSGEYDAPAGAYEDYEDGSFAGRQFYSRQGDGDDGQHNSNDYYRKQYYATARPGVELQQQQVKQQQQQQQQQQQTGYRRPPGYPNRVGQQRPYRYRPQRPQPKEEVEQETSGSSLMGFFQKAKQFYDIFQAMNSAWQTVENHYRQKNPNMANNNSTRKMILKRPRTTSTTRTPIIITPSTDEQQEQQQDAVMQEKDEYRSRRSWLKEANVVNDDDDDNNKEPTYDNSQISESDLPTDSSASTSSSKSSASSSSTTTAVAEGRYIKGDPLKGYYDFVITEGSYKFWAVFQVGTALLIIYSTFAAIYYSKVNPLVSDYDYVDYLGGGRSLSDESDFVDMDERNSSPEGVSSRSREQKQVNGGASGWIAGNGWLPHAGHTLRFILESIDKVYNEE